MFTALTYNGRFMQNNIHFSEAVICENFVRSNAVTDTLHNAVILRVPSMKKYRSHIHDIEVRFYELKSA